MIQINIGNKVFYSLLIVLGVLALGVVVYASHGGSQQGVHNPGHAFECITGRFTDNDVSIGGNNGMPDLEETIYNSSTTGNDYAFSDVFESEVVQVGSDPPGWMAPRIYCKEEQGWVVTGCTAGTLGDPGDNDARIFQNGCEGDQVGENQIYARCCRVVG